jgi:NAD(P)-dependent dehydrogenase (short-subunit alcohol dehydrogenase family)
MKAPFPAPTAEWHNDIYPSIDPTRPELSAKGKKIIVTGGGTGIGKGTVEAFAQAGAESVAITGRRLDKLTETKEYVESKYNTKVSIHAADITDAVAMQKAASEIGGWDVLVMNAGYLSKPSSIQESNVDEWWKGFEVCSTNCSFKAVNADNHFRSTSKGPSSRRKHSYQHITRMQLLLQHPQVPSFCQERCSLPAHHTPHPSLL